MSCSRLVRTPDLLNAIEENQLICIGLPRGEKFGVTQYGIGDGETGETIWVEG
jgi:hypothetical protein